VVANYDLAFASDRNGGFQVFLMDTRNGEFKEIPNPSGYERGWWPSFCGNRIAIEAVDLNGSENKKQWIYLMGLDGSQERLSAPSSPDRLGVPRCSPNGDFLAYSANVSGAWPMFVTDFSSTYQFSPPDALVSGYASWPASGSNFIFQVITQDDYRNLVYRMNGHPSAGQYGQIDTGGNPALSPDGSRMTYSCDQSGDNRVICIGQPGGGGSNDLVTIIRKTSGGEAIQPSTAWSIDGWIYYASAADGDWDIYRVRPDGSGRENLTDHFGSSDEIMPALKW
jgi:Tol biopolymer transport system component